MLLLLLQAEKTRVIQTLLLISGLSTFLQSLFGSRLASIVGGSYAFLIPTISIIQAKRFETFKDPQEVDYIISSKLSPLLSFLW